MKPLLFSVCILDLLLKSIVSVSLLSFLLPVGGNLRHFLAALGALLGTFGPLLALLG